MTNWQKGFHNPLNFPNVDDGKRSTSIDDNVVVVVVVVYSFLWMYVFDDYPVAHSIEQHMRVYQ